MEDKTVDQKLKECKTLIIQNVEKGVQSAMIFRYLKEEKIENDVKRHTHNTKDGLITLEFLDHEKARQYYDKANFRDRILIRPFNIYFNVQLNDNEMKKFYFEGANEENIRRMFDMARKIGICKIYTSYTSALASGKIKSTGLLSFVRKDISENELNELKKELATIGVKIHNYTPDKGLKCALLLTEFFKGDSSDSIESIEAKAKDQANDLLKATLKDISSVKSISPIVKRKEVPAPDNREGSKTVTTVKAMVDLGEYETALKSFETIRIAFIKESAKATLNFYNAEINSYISLFTIGLKKPVEGMTDKAFEDELVKVFRHINPLVVQVNVFPKGNDAYVARVYLKSEEEGRKFIVDYGNFRELLVKYYKSKESIRFNINVDDKTMKKIKQYDKRVSLIQTNIKNEADRQKAMNNKQAHQIPLHQGGFPMMPPIPHPHGMMNAPQGKMQMMGGSHPPMPQPGYPMVINPQIPQMGIPNPMGMGIQMMNPGMGQKNPVV